MWTFAVLLLIAGMFTPIDVVGTTNPIESVQISLSNGLLFNKPSIDFIAYLNGSLDMDITLPFEYVGPSPTAHLEIQNDQGTTPTVNPKARVVVDLIYYPEGTGRRYIWGPYVDSFLVEPENVANSLSYFINLTGQQDKVYAFLSTQVENLTIDMVGYRGVVLFNHRFEDALIPTSRGYYAWISFSLAGRMLGLKLALHIPGNSTWIDMTWQEESMVKRGAYEVGEEISIDANESIISDLYAEWEIPSEPTVLFWETPEGSYWRGVLSGLTVWGVSTIAVWTKNKNRTRISNARRRFWAWLRKRWRLLHDWVHARVRGR